jgi:hypothetical protein
MMARLPKTAWETHRRAIANAAAVDNAVVADIVAAADTADKKPALLSSYWDCIAEDHLLHVLLAAVLDRTEPRCCKQRRLWQRTDCTAGRLVDCSHTVAASVLPRDSLARLQHLAVAEHVVVADVLVAVSVVASVDIAVPVLEAVANSWTSEPPPAKLQRADEELYRRLLPRRKGNAADRRVRLLRDRLDPERLVVPCLCLGCGLRKKEFNQSLTIGQPRTESFSDFHRNFGLFFLRNKPVCDASLRYIY